MTEGAKVVLDFTELSIVQEQLLARNKMRKFYTPFEVGLFIRQPAYFVREWCRTGQIDALECRTREGQFFGWIISDNELARLESEGLLPEKPTKSRLSIDRE